MSGICIGVASAHETFRPQLVASSSHQDTSVHTNIQPAFTLVGKHPKINITPLVALDTLITQLTTTYYNITFRLRHTPVAISGSHIPPPEPSQNQATTAGQPAHPQYHRSTSVQHLLHITTSPSGPTNQMDSFDLSNLAGVSQQSMLFGSYPQTQPSSIKRQQVSLASRFGPAWPTSLFVSAL